MMSKDANFIFSLKIMNQSWQEAKDTLAPILNYDKALTQNFIITDRLYISNSIARKCLILNTNTIETKLMLSPSLVINLFNKESQADIEKYFRIKWQNAQMLFWQNQYVSDLYVHSSIEDKKTLTSLAYATNLESPNFQLINDSVKEKNNVGLIEQAINRVFR